MKNYMRGISALLAVFCFAQGAGAQTGPASAHMVLAAIPSAIPTPTADGTRSTQVELAIDATGRVTDVTIQSSSGDPKYDDRVSKYYRRLRFIPAIDTNGSPVASTMTTRMNSMRATTPGPSAPPPPSPSGSQVPDPQAAADHTADQVRRIGRMRCKDFLWEYDLMKDIAGSRSLDNEELFRELQAMYIVQENVPGDALPQLRRQFDGAVRTSVEECRKRGEAQFYQEVFAPVLKAKLSPG